MVLSLIKLLEKISKMKYVNNKQLIKNLIYVSLMNKISAIFIILLIISVSICGCNEKIQVENKEDTKEPLTDFQEWQMEYFGSVESSSAHQASDPDEDYVDNLFEFENGTEPLNVYTYEGLDDFNLLYTYPHHFTNLTNKTLTQNQINDFLDKIPDVEPRYWTSKDGSVSNMYKDGIYIEVSLRDPLLKYYSKKVHIDWRDDEEFGKLGELKLDDEELFLIYDSIETNPMVPPIYFLKNERKGNCLESAIINIAVLVSKGYNCTLCNADTTLDNGEKWISHAFSETMIGGKIYIVNYNVLTPREDKNGKNTYEKWGWNLKSNYDPNWFENESYYYM